MPDCFKECSPSAMCPSSSKAVQVGAEDLQPSGTGSAVQRYRKERVHQGTQAGIQEGSKNCLQTTMQNCSFNRMPGYRGKLFCNIFDKINFVSTLFRVRLMYRRRNAKQSREMFARTFSPSSAKMYPSRLV